MVKRMVRDTSNKLLGIARDADPRWIAGLVCLLAALPIFIRNDYHLSVMILCLIDASLAVTWNLMVGYTGILSFGHQAFYGLGAYLSGLLAIKLNISPWLGLPLGGCFAALLSLGIGLPCLRLRIAPYVAIATLAFSEIMLVISRNWVSLTRGEMGLSGIPPLSDLSLFGSVKIPFSTGARIPYYYCILIIFLITMMSVYFILRSKMGLALKSVRENQDAAASLGVNVTQAKLTAFLVSSFFAGVVGSFYAHYVSVLAPGAVFGVGKMVEIVAITLVGGIGTFFGPVAGTFALVVGLEMLRGLEGYRLMVYGAALVAITLLMPNGLLTGLKTVYHRYVRTSKQSLSRT
ncbi:MAG: branched-chain amino acid ABC transporter permease [Deltaproteobacteria bacterium]|nr:branched-chain amino acid ABC transporter permease [Deltaproteobacteria bacterium]MBW2082174.1 branched-chain amino acid ABC transporter permease [Deltaproteobacteria bacterium]